jgi:type I restriction enzyme M protein
MWRRIEIRNYRSIEHVSVDLAPFTVVVGPNGSGKSNFADAFVFARDIANDASTAVQNRGGIAGVRRWRPSRPADVTIDVRAAATQAGLDTDYARHSFTLASKREGQWEFKRELIEALVGGKQTLVMERERNKATMLERRRSAGPWVRRPQLNVSETTSAMLLVRQLTLFNRSFRLRNVRRYRLNPDAMRQPQLATERSRLDESGSNIAVSIRSLRQKPQWESVLLAMRKLVPGLSDIQEGALGRYLGVQFLQQQAGGERAEFSATEMSEGAIRALGILIAAQQMIQDELLVLEEPEVSIHPGAAMVLFDFLKRASRRGAVLLTTHSAELLDAAKDEEILVCDYRGGVTHVGPMEKEQRRLVKEGLLSAAELMRSEPLRIEGMPPDVIPHEEAR